MLTKSTNTNHTTLSFSFFQLSLLRISIIDNIQIAVSPKARMIVPHHIQINSTPNKPEAVPSAVEVTLTKASDCALTPPTKRNIPTAKRTGAAKSSNFFIVKRNKNNLLIVLLLIKIVKIM